MRSPTQRGRGGTVIYTAHWPAMHPSDFKVESWIGVADGLADRHR